jgi:hypothetical protein
MEEHRRPPVDITPERFFTQWLPAEIERLGSATGVPDMLVRITLSGQGGGTWDLLTRQGRLLVSPPVDVASPLVTLSMTVRDWRAIVVGEEGPVDLAPRASTSTDLLFVDSAAQKILATINGTFRFEVRDYNDRTWTLVATFGDQPPGDTPDSVIAIDAVTYGAILAGELMAPEAYFSGKITVEGDQALGLQVGLALLPKF